MNVKLAAQLMSNTIAKSLQYFGQQNLLKSKDWQDTSNFISLVDSWFDLFNSRTPNDIKKAKAAYGIHLEYQNQILSEMLTTAKNMRVGEKGSLYPFQKGIILSCTSLSSLFAMVSQRYNVKYIMTYRLNQDGLEHFFGCIRQMGIAHQHPSPVHFKHMACYSSAGNPHIIDNSCHIL